MNAAAGSRRTLQSAGRARLTVDEYFRIADSGVLDRFGRTELIGGEIFVVSPLYFPHARIHALAFQALATSAAGLANGLEVLIGPTLSLGEIDAPLPDITVLDFSSSQRPEKAVSPEAVRMVVEVAVSTSRHDLGRKRMLYAAAGVAEYWVVLVKKEQVQRFSDPREGDYRGCDSFGFDERIDAVTLPGMHIPAGALG